MPDDAAQVSDVSGRSWTRGPVLGRGTWGRSRLVTDPSGREAVLKEPLTAADFPPDAPLPDDLVAGCAAAARDQAEILERGSHPFLPKLEAKIDLGDGRVGVVLPRYGTTLQRRLETGLPLGDALRIVHRLALALAEASAVHGNLRPTNVLFGERGETWLADMVTSPRPHGVRLLEEAGVRAWSPPEWTAARVPAGRTDTWALCQILYAAAMATAGGEGRTSDLHLAEPGIDKLGISALKDRVHARLAVENSNPRFRARVADRMGALLSRGLSAEFEPSPPYRFTTAKELADRVHEIVALLRPRVVDVGKVMLPGNARDGVFQGGQPVALSVTVGCTAGVTDADDLVCGLQLVDLDDRADGRRPIDDARITVAVHPSGRLRFQVALPEVAPGRYRLRVAFAVKDSGDEPQVAEGEISVRPPPGYVPPQPEDPAPTPLAFPGGRTVPVTIEPTDPSSAPGTSVGDGLSDPDDVRVVPLPTPSGSGFPRPVAPPDDDDDDLPDALPAPTPHLTKLSERPTEPAEPTFAGPAVTPPLLRALPDPPDDPFGDFGDFGSDGEIAPSGDRPGMPDLAVTPRSPVRIATRAASDLPIHPGTDLPSDAVGEDLPSWVGERSTSFLDRLLALVRRDAFAAIGLCVMVVLALTLLLRAC